MNRLAAALALLALSCYAGSAWFGGRSSTLFILACTFSAAALLAGLADWRSRGEKSGLILGVVAAATGIALAEGLKFNLQRFDSEPATNLVLIQAVDGRRIDDDRVSFHGTAAEAQTRLRDEIDAELVKRFRGSDTEMWKVNTTGLARLQQLENSNRLSYLERADGAPAVLTSHSVESGDLTDGQRDLLEKAFDGADPAPPSYRVADAMPEALSAELLSDSLDSRQEVLLPLLDGVRVRLAPRDRTALGQNTFAWSGTVLEPAGGDATLIVSQEGITGTVSVGAERFRILPIGGGRHLVRRMSQDTAPAPDHPPGPIPEGTPGRRGGGGENEDAPVCQDMSEVDLLVGYTPSVAASRQSVLAVIQEAIAITNRALAESGAPDLRFRLARAAEWKHTESGIPKDLPALVAGTGGLSAAHKDRERSNADIALLLVNTPVSHGCGKAAQILASDQSAFAVVTQSDQCLINNYSFAHELGHLFGARHDPKTDPTNTPFAHGHGYISGTDWRTILAYPGACSGCPRLPLFSNPLLTHPKSNGKSTGDAGCCDEARVLRETFGRVAKLRCST